VITKVSEELIFSMKAIKHQALMMVTKPSSEMLVTSSILTRLIVQEDYIVLAFIFRILRLVYMNQYYRHFSFPFGA
jgi:hypothetical protein